jgi:hypothetical protein
MHAQCFRVFIYISYVLRAVSLNQAIRYIPSLPLSVTASMSISSKYLCHKVIKYLLHVKVVVFFQLWLLVENDAVLSGSLPQLDFEKSCVICFKIIYCIKGICLSKCYSFWLSLSPVVWAHLASSNRLI